MTVQAPAASPAAAPATPAAVTPAPATPQAGGGFLDHIKIPASSPADTKQEAAAPTTPAVTPAPTPAPGTTPDPVTPKAGEVTPTVFKTTVRGKEYTGEELAKAYENSSTEGLRLNDSVKQAKQHITTLEAKLAELEAAAADTAPFKILTKEEIKELDPADQTEYIINKNAWETQKAARKEKLAEMKQVQEAEAAESKNYIYSRSQHMYSNEAEYPGYKDLMPAMEQILDRVPSLGGMRETPDILYYAALGLQKYREGKVSKSAEETARAQTAAKAAADAAAAGAGNPPAPVGAGAIDDDSDEAFTKRILSKAPGGIFKA